MPPKERMPADYYQQMDYLKRNGVQIGDKQACLRALRNITYYRLKGYFPLFRGQRVNFETLLNIHEFDSQMRVISLRALSKIEIHLRAQFSYFHSHKYGPYGYLNAVHYSPKHHHGTFLDSLDESVHKNMALPFVRHYVEQYNSLMPFWVMSELMGLGDWFYFYMGMKGEDKEEFITLLLSGRTPPAPEALKRLFSNKWRFSDWLGCCRSLRNVCAHCGRLYGAQFLRNPEIPWLLGTSKTRKRADELNKSGFYQTLFGSLIAVMFLYPDTEEWNRDVLPEIKSRLEEYRTKGTDWKRISFPSASFPPDWEDWLQKP